MYTVSNQAGRRFVVTGSNSGTGKETTRRLVGAGASVVMGVRTIAKGETARADILREFPQADIEVRRIDLADLATVRDFAASILEDGKPLDVLVNNAGVMSPPTRMTTADGFELQFGSNFLGPFALTNLLLPLLLKTPGARVATMTSGTANFGSLRFDDLQWANRRYSPFRSYGASKLADMLMGVRLAQLATERRWNLLSTLAHPGYTRTNLQSSGVSLGTGTEKPPIERTFLPSQDVTQGAEPLLFAATDPAAEQGAYYGPSRYGLVGPSKKIGFPRSARDAALPRKIWDAASALTDVELPSLV